MAKRAATRKNRSVATDARARCALSSMRKRFGLEVARAAMVEIASKAKKVAIAADMLPNA